MKCANSNDHSRNPEVIEYSLSKYQKNVAEEARRQKKLQKKAKNYKQERDDDELINSSVLTEEIRHASVVSDNGGNHSAENLESQFSPFDWVWSFDGEEEQDKKTDDRREADGEEGKEGDQEREQVPVHENVEGNMKESKSKPRLQIFWKSSKAKERKTNAVSKEIKTRKSPSTKEKHPKPNNKSTCSSTSAKGPSKIVARARKVSKLFSKKTVPPTKSVARATTTRSPSAGAQHSSETLAKLGSNTYKTSESLTSTINRMLDANQTQEASELLVTVHEMMQKQADHDTTGLLLESIEAHIRDTASKANGNGEIVRKASRERSQKAKVIDEVETNKEVSLVDESSLGDKGQTVDSNDIILGSPSIPIIPSITEAKVIDERNVDVEDSEYDSEAEAEDDYGEGTSNTEWDGSTGKSEATLTYASEYYTDYQDDSELEIEGLTLYRDFLSEEILSEESESDDMSGEDNFGEEENEDKYSDDGYDSGATVYVDGEKASPVEYADTDFPNEDTVNDNETERDRAILYLIEDRLQQLEEEHEEEKGGILYQTFYREKWPKKIRPSLYLIEDQLKQLEEIHKQQKEEFLYQSIYRKYIDGKKEEIKEAGEQ